MMAFKGVAHIGEEFGFAAAGEFRFLLGRDQGQFGFLALGDVERDGDHQHRPAGLILQQRLGGEQHALLAFGRPDGFLAGTGLLQFCDDAAVALGFPARMRIVAHRLRRLADDRGRLLADAAREPVVDEDVTTVAVGGDHRHRHGIDDAQQQLMAFAERILVAARFLDHPLLERGSARLEQQLLAAQRQEIARAHAEFVVIDRAQQVIGGAGLERLIAQVAVLIGGDDDHRHVDAGGNLADVTDEGGAVEFGHVEIGDDQIGRRCRESVERALRPVIGRDLDAFERASEPFQNLQIGQAVVDDGDGLELHPGLRWQHGKIPHD
ncbi:MAG: hypothetical protein ABSC26_07460 [Stellaceae bacterium]